MSWTDRLDELGGWRASEVTWPEVWAVLARGELHRGRTWSTSLLWQLKLSSWLVHLDSNPSTCRTCGGRCPSSHALTRYCTTACRKVAYRCRQANKPTPFEARVAKANADLADVRREVKLAQRALQRAHRFHTAILPPDLTQIDHLPMLPPRCDNGCDSRCEHTGGMCLYAATATAPYPEITEEIRQFDPTTTENNDAPDNR